LSDIDSFISDIWPILGGREQGFQYKLLKGREFILKDGASPIRQGMKMVPYET
jgi:hypothetical protein